MILQFLFVALLVTTVSQTGVAAASVAFTGQIRATQTRGGEDQAPELFQPPTDYQELEPLPF